MDINVIRGLGSVFALIAFLSIVAWAYSSHRKKRFEDDGRILFKETDDGQEDMTAQGKARSKNDEKDSE